MSNTAVRDGLSSKRCWSIFFAALCSLVITLLVYHSLKEKYGRDLRPAEEKNTSSSADRLLKALHFVLNLDSKEKTVFSQNGEDGITEAVLEYIQPKWKYYVEFGTEDAKQCNTRILREKHKGWRGLMMDGNHEDSSINLHREYITADNIVSLFQKYNVPKQFDVLSVDTDFKDYWILKSILEANYRPRYIIVETNTFLQWDKSITVPRDSSQKFWDGSTQYFGFSIFAGWKLARQYGYSMIYCDRMGVNCMMIIDGVEGFGEGSRLSDYILPQHLFRPNKLTHTPDSQRRPYVNV